MKTAVVIFSAFITGLAMLSVVLSATAERAAPPIGEFVDVDGRRMHVAQFGVEHRGERPSIVLIHGASSNLRDMRLALGEALKAKHHVVIVDRPGLGWSERPQEGFALETQARLIRDAATAAGARQPIVVGHSFGGAVALSYALQFQEEMSGLVLLAPVSHEWPGGVAWYNTASQTPVLGIGLRRFVIPVYGSLIGPKSVDAAFSPGPPPNEYFRRAGVRLLFRPKSFRANAEDVFHLKSEVASMQGRYGELTIPVAIFAGDRDAAVSTERHAKALAREVETANLVVLSNAGHSLHHQNRTEIIAAIQALSDKYAP